MEFLSDIFGLSASAASGGLFGFVGSVVGQVSKYFQEKQRQEWEKKKWEHEESLLKLQMQSKQLETEAELAIIAQEGSFKGLETSIQDSSHSVSDWVSDLKGVFRPALTLILWALASFVFFEIINSVTDFLSTKEKNELVKYMVYSIFFTACTATAWWFGDRALTPPQFKNK